MQTEEEEEEHEDEENEENFSLIQQYTLTYAGKIVSYWIALYEYMETYKLTELDAYKIAHKNKRPFFVSSILLATVSTV